MIYDSNKVLEIRDRKDARTWDDLACLHTCKIDGYEKPIIEQFTAFPFDEDKFEGDSAFYPSSTSGIPYVVGETKEQLTTKWLNLRWDSEDPEDRPEIAGFWIIPNDQLNILDAVWPVEGVGNDSANYRLNSVTKRLAAELAIKVIE